MEYGAKSNNFCLGSIKKKKQVVCQKKRGAEKYKNKTKTIEPRRYNVFFHYKPLSVYRKQ